MARPVWILLPHLADWRWGNEGESSPWYPTARLYRQATAGDWEGLLGRVISDLIELNEARPRTVWRRRAPECQAVEQGSA